MSATGNFVQLPSRENHRCFGCSPINPCGLQMKFFSDGNIVFSELTVPDHLSGWQNLVHGGITSTMLDEIMGWSAIYLLKRFVLTKSITVEFLKPLYVGKTLRVEGRVVKVRNDREAILEGSLFDSEGKLCARASGVFAIFALATAIKRGLIDESAIGDLERLFAA